MELVTTTKKTPIHILKLKCFTRDNHPELFSKNNSLKSTKDVIQTPNHKTFYLNKYLLHYK